MLRMQEPTTCCTDSTGYHLEVFDSPKAFAALRQDWQDLQRRASQSTVFQTHTWLSHVCELECNQRARLQIAAVRDDAGKLVAIAPMVIERRLGMVNVRVLRFLSRGFNDYQDILLADDCDTRKVVATLGHWLSETSKRLDRIELLKLPEGAHLWKHRDQLTGNTLCRWQSEAEVYDQTRYEPLKENFEAYYNALSKQTRRNFRRYSESLASDHPIDWQVLTSSQGVDDTLNDLFRLHQQRQNERGQRGMFRSPQRIELFTRLFKAMLDEGSLKLHVLKVNGRVYNLDLVFYHSDTATVYNGGMDNDPAVAKHSPGFLTMCRTVEHAHTCPGLRIFDLGQGDEPYKAHIAKQTRPLYRLRWSRNNLRCHIDSWFNDSVAWAQQNPTVQRMYAGLKG